MSASSNGDEERAGCNEVTYSFFFYGTLCHPAILGRVLNRSCGELQFQDALLSRYTRHHVRGEDYPALIDRNQAAKLRNQAVGGTLAARREANGCSGSNGSTGMSLGVESENDWEVVHDQSQRGAKIADETVEGNCRGTLVHGLTYNDILALDIFEGTEYSRQQVSVLPLSSAARYSSSESTRVVEHLEGRTSIDSTTALRMARHAAGMEEALSTDGNPTELEAGSADEQAGAIEGTLSKTAWVYLWSDPVSKLEPEEWDFASFLRDKAHLWTGLSTTEYDEVERHHALADQPGLVAREEPPAAITNTGSSGGKNGEGQGVPDSIEVVDKGVSASTTPEPSVKGPNGAPDRVAAGARADSPSSEVEGAKAEGYPDFGRNMRQYWPFAESTINLNNGSYGAAPLPITRRRQEIADDCERDPNRFMKRTYAPMLAEARQAVADLIGAGENKDEVVLVPNASSGVQLILREIEWEEGDVILVYNSTYGAIAQSVKYICDRHTGVSMQAIQLDMPVSHQSIVDATNDALRQLNRPSVPNYTGRPRATGVEVDKRVRMVVMDHIASMPGIVFPLANLVKLCKDYGVISLVDAAHALGQIKVDVKAIDPDFWISNCHKWLYTPRACAVLYVPMRNQQLVLSSFPTGPGYESKRYPTQTGGPARQWVFAPQYDWTGTIDWSPCLTIPACVAFRAEIGGEERIRRYCRDLAIKGGKRLAERWGTRVMRGERDELTACMVNVELPSVPDPKDLEEQVQQLTYFEDVMLGRNVFCMTDSPWQYRFSGRWWARFSAQVWCELSDFNKVANVLDAIIEGIRQGKHRKEDVNVLEETREQENAVQINYLWS